MAVKKREAPKGAPEWVVTYGDMMSLLLCFFVLLVAMSELKRDVKFKKVMQSIRQAFGYRGGIGTVPTDISPDLTLLKTLEQIKVPEERKQIGDSTIRGVEGKRVRVTQIRDSIKIAFGGSVIFERFSDRLLPGSEEVLAAYAERIRGLTNIIDVVGHTTMEDLPADAPFPDKDALAMARAQRARDILAANGVEARRMRVVSAADHEPAVRQAYDEDRRALNRRVEIIIREALLNEVSGEGLQVEDKVINGW